MKGLGIKGFDGMMAFASCCGYWKLGTFVQELKLEILPYHHNDLVLQILNCFNECYRSKIKMPCSVVFTKFFLSLICSLIAVEMNLCSWTFWKIHSVFCEYICYGNDIVHILNISRNIYCKTLNSQR